MPHVSARDLSDAELEELLGARLTYGEVGATLAVLPSPYRHLEMQARVGFGRASFDAVSRLVMSWEMHRRAGLVVRASHPTAAEGAVAVLRLGVGVVGVNAPVRVVLEIDEPRRRGFAYGTLAGHPESGEELFVVEHHADDRVTLTIRAFSRASTRLARLGGPVTRSVQSLVTRRYLHVAAELGRQHAERK